MSRFNDLGRAKETARVRLIWDRFASRYDDGIASVERLLFAGGREWVCAQAQGRVLEIAVGTGRNLPFYGADVHVTGVDFSPSMLVIARERARSIDLDADLREGDAQALDFADQSFDTVVSTLALCSIPDDRRAVAEARRVLRPGGRFLLMEHVRSHLLPVRLIERALDPLAVRWQGDHVCREPLDHLRAEGFQILRQERLKLGIVERVTARRPADGEAAGAGSDQEPGER
jgi:ubiquinone/menaquinone biosynthesis C-methylase UbiE